METKFWPNGLDPLYSGIMQTQHHNIGFIPPQGGFVQLLQKFTKLTKQQEANCLSDCRSSRQLTNTSNWNGCVCFQQWDPGGGIVVLQDGATASTYSLHLSDPVKSCYRR